MEPTVFISYSRKDKAFLDRVTPALRAVPKVRQALWYDEHKIDYGDKFDDKIRAALETSRVGILLISPHFFNSDYIKSKELPFLIEREKRGVLSLGIVYLTATPRTALVIEGLDLSKTYHSFTTPDQPLDSLEPNAQSAVFAKLADWVKSKLPADSPITHRSGERHQLALRLRRGRKQWDHQLTRC